MAGDPNTVLVANPGADLYGSDRMAVETVRALVRSGRRVFVTVPGPGPLVELFIAAGARVFEQPTPILRKGLASPRGVLQLARESLFSALPSWRLLRQTDAGTVLVNTITPPIWFLLGRLAARKLVCHVHEAERSVRTPVRWALYLPLVLCHTIVVNSWYTAQVLRESSRGLSSRVTVVHNTVAGPPAVQPPRQHLEGPTRLLYVGRLSHRKGPHVAIEATRLLRTEGRDVRLVLVGAAFEGNEVYEQQLRAQVADQGLDDAVVFAGFQRDVWAHLARCDIALVPSTGDESFGNAAVEASLAARPVVVSDVGGLNEATACTTARMTVPPGDARALADAVAAITDDWDGFASRARADAATVARRFSFDRYATELTEMLSRASRGYQLASAVSRLRSRRYQATITKAV